MISERFGIKVLAMKDGTTMASGKTGKILETATFEWINGLKVDVFKSPDNRRTVVIPK